MGLFKDCGCGCNGKKQQDKLVISIISGLTFFIVANPETFRLVRRVSRVPDRDPYGCPSTMGLLVHTLVFILVVWGMMNIKKEGGGLVVRKERRVWTVVVPRREPRLLLNPQFPWLRPPTQARICRAYH
jgi:hypothetical protein